MKNSPDEILKFLQSLPLVCFSILLERHFLPFGPIEDSSFFSINNEVAFNDGKDIPLLATITKHEGDFFTWFILRENISDLLTDNSEVYSKFIQQYLRGFLTDDSILLIDEFYQNVKTENPEYEIFHKISEMIGDTVINLSFIKFLKD